VALRDSKLVSLKKQPKNRETEVKNVEISLEEYNRIYWMVVTRESRKRKIERERGRRTMHEEAHH
jgi:hypothetical protein